MRRSASLRALPDGEVYHDARNLARCPRGGLGKILGTREALPAHAVVAELQPECGRLLTEATAVREPADPLRRRSKRAPGRRQPWLRISSCFPVDPRLHVTTRSKRRCSAGARFFCGGCEILLGLFVASPWADCTGFEDNLDPRAGEMGRRAAVRRPAPS